MAKEEVKLVNENLKSFSSVLVIDQNSQQLGVMSGKEAVAKAYEEGFDLLCVSPKATTPVCKFVDYGKVKFDEKKKAKEAKKHQQETETKSLRLSPVIDTNDFNTKLKQAKGWLEAGMKVKVDMRFKGRMMTRQEVGKSIMDNFKDGLSAIASVDGEAKMEGNTLSCVFAPKGNK